jgi:hypothetical protein
MQNVAPSHTLVRRSRQLLILAFLVVSAGTFIAVVGLALFVLPLAPKANEAFQVSSSFVFVLGVIVGLVGLGLAVRAVTWRTDNDLAKMTGASFEQHLDDRYTYIRNVSRRRLGYIDAVLVGPPGALVFRILDNEGSFFNEKNQWLKGNKQGGWSPMRFNPTSQAITDIHRLREYLEKQGLKEIPVYGVIVFTKNLSLLRLSFEQPTVPVGQLPDTLECLRDNYLAKERLDQATVAQVIKTLYHP